MTGEIFVTYIIINIFKITYKYNNKIEKDIVTSPKYKINTLYNKIEP